MRSIWKGAIRFGLVNIPVNLYTGSQERELHFTLLHKPDLSEIRYAKICKAEGKEVPYNEIVKGYEVEKGHYVVLTEEDFKKADIEKTQAIEIFEFIHEEEVDPIYFEKPYFLEPGKNAAKPYALLREALKKSKKVALAKYVLRNHEHLAVIKPHEDLLILNQLRLHSEITPPKDLSIKTEKISEKELSMALKLIDQLTGSFKPEKYKDTYAEDLKKLIKQKSKGKMRVTAQTKETAPRSPKVHDIMSLLKASLEEKPTKAKRKAK